MFVRKKANASGSISVQVIDKAGGYRVVKSIGAAREPDEVQRLVSMGNGRRLIVSYSDKRAKKDRDDLHAAQRSDPATCFTTNG